MLCSPSTTPNQQADTYQHNVKLPITHNCTHETENHVLDSHRSRHTTIRYLNHRLVIMSARRIVNIIEQGEFGKRIALVDGIGGSERRRRVEINDTCVARLAKDFGGDEGRVEDGADGPLVVGTLVGWGSCAKMSQDRHQIQPDSQIQG